MSNLDFLFGKGGLAAVTKTAAEPAHSIAAGLGIEQEGKKQGANDAFPLSGRDAGWLVLSGTLDIFHMAPVPGGAAAGALRRHVLRVPEGGVALALGHEDGGPEFLAVPSNGAELVRFQWSRLFPADADTDLARATVQGLEAWIAAVAATALKSLSPPTLEFFDPSAPLALRQGQAVGLHDSLCWLPVGPAVPGIAGEDGAAVGERAHIPLAPGLWMEPAADDTVTPLTLAQWSATALARQDLMSFHDTAVASILAKADRLQAEETARTMAARQRRSATLARALSGLATVLRRGRVGLTGLPKHPTAAATMLVWRYQGIDRRLSTAAEARVAAAADPIGALSHEGGLFFRKVHLEGRWWRGDHGPMAGTYGEDARPCALLPVGGDRYNLVDPQAGLTRRIDAAVAASVDPTAFTFFEPFPAGRLGARELLRFGFGSARGDLTRVILMALVVGLLSLAVPMVTGWIMDPVIPEAEMQQLAILIGALLVAGVSTTLFSLVQSLSMLRLEGRMGNRVQSAIWDRLLRLPAPFFRRYSVGDLANRAQGIDRMRALLTGTATASLLHAVTAVFSFGYMLYVSWRLALITLLLAAIYCVVVLVVGRKILLRNRESMTLSGRLQGIVLQLLGAVAKLRVAGAESGAFGRWAEPYARLLRIGYEQQRLNNLLVVFKSGFHYVILGSLIAVIALQGHELLALFKTPTTWAGIDATRLHTIMPTGKFVSFHVAFGQFLSTVFAVTSTLVQLTNVKPLYERVQPILEAEQEDASGDLDPGELSGALEIRDVRFRYAPDAPLVMDGLSMSARPGEFIAIVGPSGAGKSTLVRLLLGFETPEAGSIFYDGMDVAQLEKRRLRRQLGVVLQNGRLLSGSMFHNITAGANMSRDDAMWAARLAGLDKDIEQMPMGLDTFLGEGASTLSGGQRQRLMIARAVVQRPRILIFDEATSALDNETQAIVSRGVESLNATRLVIAHRLSTVARADRIYVLTGGKVVEEGTFDALMEKNGVFAALARRQMA